MLWIFLSKYLIRLYNIPSFKCPPVAAPSRVGDLISCDYNYAVSNDHSQSRGNHETQHIVRANFLNQPSMSFYEQNSVDGYVATPDKGPTEVHGMQCAIKVACMRVNKLSNRIIQHYKTDAVHNHDWKKYTIYLVQAK